MSFKERLEEAAKHAGVPFKQAAIAKFLGIARQTVHQWFHGAIPEPKQSNDAAAKFGVNSHWFATGQGDMVPAPSDSSLSSEEKDIIKFYRKAQPQRRKALYDMAKAMGKAVVVAAFSIPGLQIDGAQANTLHKTAWSASVLHIVKQWLKSLLTIQTFKFS